MTYRHDIFISYRRQLLWTPWTRDHFKALLSAHLQAELGRAPEVFVDERIEIGQDWVDELGTHLATAKALIAALSGDYFTSPWCVHELDLMLGRGRGLVIPIIVHNCENLPSPVDLAQSADFKDYRRTHMAKDGDTYAKFSDAVARVARAIGRAIADPPAFNASWVAICRARMQLVYDAGKAGAPLPPTLFTPPPAPAFRTPPRLKNSGNLVEAEAVLQRALEISVESYGA